MGEHSGQERAGQNRGTRVLRGIEALVWVWEEGGGKQA